MAGALVAVALTLSGAIVMLTPLRTLLPGYMKESQRSATEEGLLRLDSLMDAYEEKSAYIDNFLRVTDTDRIPGDSSMMTPTERELTPDSLLTASNRERKFVSQMAEREKFNISVLAPLAADGITFSPAVPEGLFTSESQTDNLGVIIFPSDESIQCTADGSVIALYHSADDRGFVVTVQHPRGFITSYGGVGTPLVGIGDNVNAGQVIALSPSPDSKGVRKIYVRMWHNGLPLVPYDYLGNPAGRRSLPDTHFEDPRGRL